LRDEFNEIQSIIEGGKSIEVIELDENDVTMDENKEDDDVIEIAHFPTYKQRIFLICLHLLFSHLLMKIVK
jgi:hypothetical protein